MQRLFSMFPVGAPGLALVVLRLAVASQLWPGPAAILLALPLGLGVLTPAAAAACAIVHGARLIDAGVVAGLPELIAVADACALALLGPGAYSVDARLFGRRVFVVSDRSGSS